MNIKQLVDKLSEIAKNPKYQPNSKGGGTGNLLQIINQIDKEVINNNIIAYFLNPKEKHQHPEYLRLFLDQLSNFKGTTYDNIKITREYSIKKQCRIDILIESDNWIIIIESKINAKEQPAQLDDYYEFFKKDKSFEKKIYIYFLTLKNKSQLLWLKIIKNN